MTHVLDHPLVKVHLTGLRDRTTPPDGFRRHLTAVSRLLAYPALARLTVQTVAVESPLGAAPGWRLGSPPILVPVLRAGLGMVEGFLDVAPQAVVSHLGLYRDHDTLEPVRYYTNFPTALARDLVPVFLLDPMLATGGSAVDACRFLKEQGVRTITLVSVIAAPEGVAHLGSAHPDVDIFTAAVDDRLNERAYIVPGLGDAGDRQFGTLT